MARNAQASLTQDEVFDILSNVRRRFVLYYLRKEDGPVDLDELARELAAWENETSVEELEKQQRKRVYVSLYQTHIEKLADSGVIEYDRDSGMLALDDAASGIDTYLADDTGAERAVRWQEFYILLAAASGLIYGLVAFDVSVLGLVSEFQVGTAIVVAFSALATVHYLYNRRRNPDVPTDALIQRR